MRVLMMPLQRDIDGSKAVRTITGDDGCGIRRLTRALRATTYRSGRLHHTPAGQRTAL
jgi:hypothetical protein